MSMERPVDLRAAEMPSKSSEASSSSHSGTKRAAPVSAASSSVASADERGSKRVKHGKAPTMPIVPSMEAYRAKPGHAARLKNLESVFHTRFGGAPSFLVRAPGRVNLIGEHIDYCGYSVLPMALAQDVLMAVRVHSSAKRSDKAALRISNVNPQFVDCEFPLQLVFDAETKSILGLPSFEQLSKGPADKNWSIYVLCGLYGVVEDVLLPRLLASAMGSSLPAGPLLDPEKLTSGLESLHLDIVVDGNVPRGAGVSSSSAMVCASALAFLHGAGLTPHTSQTELASACIRAERYCGAESGGMDQTICLTAHEGFAKHIQFHPLSGEDVQLPSTSKFVVANCLLPHSVSTSHYNVRVVECRLAALLLGQALALPDWQSIATLADVEKRSGLSPKELIDRLEVVFAPSKRVNGTQSDNGLQDTLSKLGLSAEAAMHGLPHATVLVRAALDEFATRRDSTASSSPTESAQSHPLARELRTLKLKQRATHVFSETARVREFVRICQNDTMEDVDKSGELAALLNSGHESAQLDYECSCVELDDLRRMALAAGAAGVRLTGAGWGGCVVCMLPWSVDVERFLEDLESRYYSVLRSRSSYQVPSVAHRASYAFATEPAAGACVYLEGSGEHADAS